MKNFADLNRRQFLKGSAGFTFAIGARQLVVQEALDIETSPSSSISSLTPTTIVRSTSSFAGTVSITRFAPAAM